MSARTPVRRSFTSTCISSRDFRTTQLTPPAVSGTSSQGKGDMSDLARFARLTAQEEKHGLLDDTATIGTRQGWEARLRERGFAVRGHRLVRRKEGKGP